MRSEKSLVALGRAIRARREAMGFSQESFADHISMHRTYYGQIERGGKNLTLSLLDRVALGLGTKPSVVLSEADW